MSIVGWFLAWCGSGLNNVCVDIGAEINKELSFRYAVISSRCCCCLPRPGPSSSQSRFRCRGS